MRNPFLVRVPLADWHGIITTENNRLWFTGETNNRAFYFNLPHTDFWHNHNGPAFVPGVVSAPVPPPPPPSAPPPPPLNTVSGHKRQGVDCRKLSWEQLSPDVVNRDTIWKKVIFRLLIFILFWMLFNREVHFDQKSFQHKFIVFNSLFSCDVIIFQNYKLAILLKF